MNKRDDNYQEGFEDGFKHAQKTYISLDEVNKTFDKFFDRINYLNKIVKGFHNHFRVNKTLTNKIMETEEEKQENLIKLLALIDNDKETINATS